MSAQRQLSLLEGRRRRDAEIEGHRERKGALLDEIDRRLKSLSKARSSGVVDADDAHEILSELCSEPPWQGPVPSDTRFLGGLWQGEGWTRTGYKASRRPENHMRPIAQFVWNGERPEQGGRDG